MVARQASHPTTSAAAAGGGHANTPSTSSIKPTGWIRSDSASKPSSGALSDRTNLPSTSRYTPVRSFSKPPAAASSVQSVHSRTPTTNVKGASGKQQKLSSFFVPNTAPLAAPVANGHRSTKSILCQDSPTLDRAQRSHSSNGSVGRNEARPSKLAVFEDQELEARAASLLRGRFGSVSRSLNPSRSSTPTRAASPRSDPDPPRPARIEQANMARPRPQPQPTSPPKTYKPAAQVTPPRLKRFEQQQPPSSPMFHQTLMQESLSNFTPPAWEKARGSNMALFQRLAGLPPEDIKDCEKKRMEEELQKAHRRMQGRSPTAARGKDEAREKVTSPLRKEVFSSANRVKQAAALSSASPRKAVPDARPNPVMRSPRTKRRIYALETQLADVPGGRATSLQPFSLLGADEGAQQRRAASEARYNGAETSRHNSILPASMQEDPTVVESETQPLPWPEESETQPLAWPDDEDDMPAAADAPPDAVVTKGEETQLLLWDDAEEPDPAPLLAAPTASITTLAPHLQKAVAEVPTSDDEDILLQTVAVSSSPPASPLQSRSTSPTSSSLHPISPVQKRRRIDSLNSSPTLSRAPLQRLAKVSPITLTPTAPDQIGTGRFDRVVAALRKEERRQNTGTQLSLNGFISQRKDKRLSDEEVEQRRLGLSEDLDDELSDDEVGEGDVTMTWNPPAFGATQGEQGGEETQPLPWSSPDVSSQSRRPAPLPLQSSQTSPATQYTYTSPTSSSSSGIISVPSQTNLREAGGSQMVNFIDRL